MYNQVWRMVRSGRMVCRVMELKIIIKHLRLFSYLPNVDRMQYTMKLNQPDLQRVYIMDVLYKGHLIFIL